MLMAALWQMNVDCNGSVVPIEVLSDATSLKDNIKLKTDTLERDDREDSFFVVDLGRLLHVHNKWRAALPNVDPFYAVKCNEDPLLLKTLAALGTGFDCASKNEIKSILDLGVSPDRIIYANPCKQVSHLKFAAKKGVELMTFDDELELYKIKKYFPTAKLVVRIRADCANLVLQLGVKYGCSVSSAKNLLHVAASIGLAVVGVSFHVGSDCETPSSYLHALQLASEVLYYADSVGHHLTLLDIGGGFPGSKTKDDLFYKMVSCINKGLDLFGGIPDLKVIAEPGRYFACSTHATAVNVIGKKVLQPADAWSLRSFMYYVNDGVYGSFNGVLYEHATPSPALLKDADPGSHSYKASIWGPTCDGVDKICESVTPELEVGDWLYFDNMGAYSLCAFSSFNGFSRPPSYYYVKESESERLCALLGVCRDTVELKEDVDNEILPANPLLPVEPLPLTVY